MDRLWLALIVGILQGIFEWLPVSSEGNVALYLAVVEGLDPATATAFALFLHAGTAVAAAAYYRGDLALLLANLPEWRFGRREQFSDLTFLVAATLISGIVGIVAYVTLIELFTVLAGGAFVVLIGVLLVATGLFQRLAAAHLGSRDEPTLPDAFLVGVLQGFAILPGVSRSGTTVSALLLLGYDAEASFRLSFLLSIPAAAGAGLLVLLDDVGAIQPDAAIVALVASAVVGYLTIDVLLRLVRRIAFWVVCVGLGVLAVGGGLVTML